MKPICAVANRSENVLGIILPSVQQQTNGVNLSFFATAFAVGILNGFAEVGKRFDIRKISSHLHK